MLHVCAGLLGVDVCQTRVARSAPRLHADSSQHSEGAIRRGELGEDLDSRYVLPQRETRNVPRSHRQQSVTSSQRYRLFVVRHQVSYIPTALINTYG